MASGKTQLQRLRNETDPERACELALELLRDHRERQIVDVVLLKLKGCALGESARAVLRPRVAFYLDNPDYDSGCDIRDALVRLLLDIGNPADLNLYLRGVEVHEKLHGVDVAQNLRAAALVGIAMVDPTLGSAYAIKLLADLADTSRFSGEPAITAMGLLHEQGDTLPLYHHLLMLAQIPDPPFPQVKVAPEVESKALELLDAGFPVGLYREIATPYVKTDRVIPQVGIVSYIVSNRRIELYDLLETIVQNTRHDDLHRYTVIEMAASRHAPLINLLYRLAGICAPKHIPRFIEAIELTSDTRRDDLLAGLKKRI
jgi:hypothetical protein